MDFLTEHWHCIIPAAAIGAALLIMKMREKADSGNKKCGKGAEKNEKQ